MNGTCVNEFFRISAGILLRSTLDLWLGQPTVYRATIINEWFGSEFARFRYLDHYKSDPRQLRKQPPPSLTLCVCVCVDIYLILSHNDKVGVQCLASVRHSSKDRGICGTCKGSFRGSKRRKYACLQMGEVHHMLVQRKKNLSTTVSCLCGEKRICQQRLPPPEIALLDLDSST